MFYLSYDTSILIIFVCLFCQCKTLEWAQNVTFLEANHFDFTFLESDFRKNYMQYF